MRCGTRIHLQLGESLVALRRMKDMIFVLGANGFIGREVVIEAIAQGLSVKGLVRSREAAAQISSLGATALVGDGAHPESWIAEAAEAVAIVDLTQPKLPKRLGKKAIRAMLQERMAVSESVLSAIRKLPQVTRPVLFFMSGADDLELGQNHVISHLSALRTEPMGFGRLGIPLRKKIESSGVDAVFLYLGSMVYGPGKALTDTLVPGIRAGKFPIVQSGENRLPLVHVKDAARAIVHLVKRPRAELIGRTFLAINEDSITQGGFVRQIAQAEKAPAPKKVPKWLAKLFAGSVLIDSFTLDAKADASALTNTGFKFRYPSISDGLDETLKTIRSAHE